MNITIGIVAYNEEKDLPRVLENIREQTYPHENIEIVLADSCSTDGTRKLMEQFQNQYQDEFFGVQIIENKGKIQSCGWNVVIDSFSTDALIRVDAHSSIPPEFVSENVKGLEEGEFVTGGVRPNIVAEDSSWQRTLLTAESSMFGSSAADFRRNGEKAYVKSFFHGCYRREVFEKVGHFREDLGRTEDNEFHYRIRQNGFQLCRLPGVISYQLIRPSFGKMCHQKYGNGYWIGLTSGVCLGCLSLYHFVPGAFVLGILGTTILALFGWPILAYIMWGLYWFLAIVMAAMAVKGQKKEWGDLLLPILFFLLHVSYGVGTVIGLIKMPFWRGKHRE